MIQDSTLGEIGMGAFRARQWSDGAWCGNETLAWEAAGCAIRDAVMAHVINKIKFQTMLESNPGAMRFGHTLLEMLNKLVADGALHPVAADDAK